MTDPVNDPNIAPPPPQPNGRRRAVDAPQTTAVAKKEKVYLIHRGAFVTKVPAVKREVIVSDEADPEFGNVREIEVAPAYEVAGTHPKSTKYGRCKIGVAHEITDPAEEEALRAKGFEDATAEEIAQSTKANSTDAIAERDRKIAAAKFEAETTGRRRAATDNDTTKTLGG